MSKFSQGNGKKRDSYIDGIGRNGFSIQIDEESDSTRYKVLMDEADEFIGLAMSFIRRMTHDELLENAEFQQLLTDLRRHKSSKNKSAT